MSSMDIALTVQIILFIYQMYLFLKPKKTTDDLYTIIILGPINMAIYVLTSTMS